MPAANGLQDCIADSLTKSLAASKKSVAGTKDVSSVVTSSAKRALLEKATITFVKAEKDANSMLQNLKDKYICLTQNFKRESSDVGKTDNSSAGQKDSKKQKSDGLPTPRIVLYSPDEVQLAWSAPRRVGGGFTNLGNTCFLNSVLQCLGYTAPLASHLISGQHKTQCRCNGFCMLCELEHLLSKCLVQHGGVLKPLNVLQKLKLIAKHLRWGRQEDAHEFLRYIVDAMQKSCLTGQNPSLEKLSKETTFVHQVFGGYLRSQVKCMQCKTTSRTYDPVLDVSLDIKGVNSVERGLQKFVQPEILDVDNAYRCSRCQKKVRALKQFTIHRAPKVLTLHLKRFDYHRLMGGKVSRHIDFSSTLNLRPYMSHREGNPVNYQLYAVLVHSGFSCNSGHYYCYIKAPNQTWYCMNDSHVSQTGVKSVLSSEAYILFYSQLPSDQTTNVSNTQRLTGQQKINANKVHTSAKSHTTLHKHTDSSNSTRTPETKSTSSQPSLISTPLQGQAKIPTSSQGPAKIPTPSQGPTKIPTPSQGPAKIPTPSQGSAKILTPSHGPAKIPTPSQGPAKIPTPSQGPAKISNPSQDMVKISTPSQGSTKTSTPSQGSTKTSTPSQGSTKTSSTPSQGSAKRPTLSAGTSLKQMEAVSTNPSSPRRVPLTKLMSPPRNPVVSPTTRMAGSNWQVVTTNGHFASHSDSEAGSINSTSSWTVSTTTKDHHKSKAKHAKEGDIKKKKRSRKGNPVSEEGSSSSMSSEKENRMSHSTGSNSCDIFEPAKKKVKQDSKNCLQLSNETTPEPHSVLKKKKRRKRKKNRPAPEGRPYCPSSVATADQGVVEPQVNAASPISVTKPTSNSIGTGTNHVSVTAAPDHAIVSRLTQPQKSETVADSTLLANVKQSRENKKQPSELYSVNGYCSRQSEKSLSSSQSTGIHSNGVSELSEDVEKPNAGSYLTHPHVKDVLKENGHATPRSKGKKRRFSEPVVKVWNASVDKDDAAFQRVSNSVSPWDGRKESNISFLMERHASKINGLGTGVSTWDGSKPEVNREVEREKLTTSYRNSWYDGYEQEIDEGRRKKVKVKKHGGANSRDHFQSIQNTTNKVRQLKREGKLPSLSSYDF
ncbi:ubiquitin carboxyl-terminal hydrolase 36-like [Watersipora subatra]|uniref:ubiquitin carboxyl-terminal hydrolase 36-like n=1 Tax=Watersipora subatra TaxID=2589382 RepID=UPI00355B9871